MNAPTMYLNEDKSRGFHNECCQLDQDAVNVELRLSIGSDGDPKGDNKHVGHGGAAVHLLAHEDANGVDKDWHQSFEHLRVKQLKTEELRRATFSK